MQNILIDRKLVINEINLITQINYSDFLISDFGPMPLLLKASI